MALKVLDLKKHTDLQELEEEIEFMRTCDDPRIVSLYGSYLWDEKLWYRTNRRRG